MALNPKRLRWTAPTENVDDTPITYDLGYNLFINGTPVASFPGTLNPDGNYEILFEDLALALEGTHQLALQAFSVDNPDRASELSESIEVTFRPNPRAPVNLGAE